MRHLPISDTIPAVRGGAWRSLLLAASVGLLAAGCAYDPYTGTYVPCCAAYPYPYPAPYLPGAPPPAAPAAEQPPEPYPPVDAQPLPPMRPAAGRNIERRFAEANVTGDGRLTFAQAQQAGWRVVARNFGAIDAQRKGYATLDDIRAWLASRPRGVGPG